MKYTDVILGAAMVPGTMGLNKINELLALIIAGLTIGILTLRLRRAWRHRNLKPRETLEDEE